MEQGQNMARTQRTQGFMISPGDLEIISSHNSTELCSSPEPNAQKPFSFSIDHPSSAAEEDDGGAGGGGGDTQNIKNITFERKQNTINF